MQYEIVITKSDGFTVHYEDRKAKHLCWEEMLGVIAALTIPERKPCLQWLRTEEQDKKLEEYYVNLNKETNKEFINLSQNGEQC